MQLLNAISSIPVVLSDNCKLFKEVHSAKVPFSIVLTPLGSFTSVNDLQFENASFRMTSNLSGNLISFKFWQS